jgi:Rps23 Pro-64 3,4-dihydroxylase Tpa1-like proline 4-hydroxylase
MFKIVEKCVPDQVCEDLILLGEQNGFKTSLFNGVLDNTFRNSLSSRFTSTDFLSELLVKHCPEEYNGKKFVGLTAHEINILKYNHGNYFKPHTDGVHVDKQGNMSKITVQVYLNDVEEGGETKFYINGKVYSLKPKKGTVAFFDHLIVHEGAKVKKGVKYTFRINAMYSP